LEHNKDTLFERERLFTFPQLLILTPERVGTIQALVSDYERDKLRLSAEMAVRFAVALEVTTDELLGVQPTPKNGRKPSRKVLRRLEQIERLPKRDQEALLRTIDAFLAKSPA
jgi:transcriptional regulator with XRE-family HTH domain